MKKNVYTAALLLALGLTANAQMIGSTNNQRTSRESRTSSSPLYRPTGGSLRFSIGAPQNLTVSYNHYLTSYFMIGGGLGFGTQDVEKSYYRPGYYDGYSSPYWVNAISDGYSTDGTAMPVFVEMDLRTPKYKWSLFLNVKVGLNLFGEDDSNYDSYYDIDYYGNNVYTTYYCSNTLFLFSAAAGVSYKNLNLGFGVSNVDEMENLNFFFSYNLPLTTIDKWLFH